MGSVAESGTTVLLSSHLLTDLERVCDFLIVLHDAKPQLVGNVDDLIAKHRQLVGPRHDSDTIPAAATVIRASHTDRQSTLLVRTSIPITDPTWAVHEVTLEDLVLAYLADGDVVGSHVAWGVPA